MHEAVLSHTTDWSVRDVAGRLGVACTDQVDPSEASAIEKPCCVAPTAVQPDEATQLTPLNVALPTPALDCMVQATPSHASASAVSVFEEPGLVDQPTAVHEVAPVHETASR